MDIKSVRNLGEHIGAHVADVLEAIDCRPAAVDRAVPGRTGRKSSTGVIGPMMPAVMTRASLGHTGRPLTSTRRICRRVCRNRSRLRYPARTDAPDFRFCL